MTKAIFRNLAFLLSVILLYSVLLSSCSSVPATTTSSITASSAAPSDAANDSGPSTSTSYKVGISVWGTGVPVMDAFVNEIKYSLSVFGATSNVASDDFTPEKELANIQNFCSAGMDGIVMMGAAVSTVPRMAESCMDAKVPFVMYTQIGADADRQELEANNPYYVGAIDSNMINEGKTVADMAIAAGCTKAVIIGGNIGDSNMDQRSKGFTDEFIAKGGTVLAEARCTDASECVSKAEDTLSAHKDTDCLYAMVGDYVSGSLSALDNLGMTGKVKVYLSCVDKASAESIKAGTVAGGTDGINLASLLSPTLLINYLDGHPIKDSNGKPPRFQTMPIPVTKDNVDAYMSVFCSDTLHPVADSVLKSLCWRYNSNVSYQSYVDLLTKGLTLNEILKANNLPTVD